jgi:two-component system OmpR family sensor kinase
MKRFSGALTRSVVVAALAATLLTWAVASTLLQVGLERARHATLDAASVAVRDAISNAGPDEVRRWLGSMSDTLATWNLDAAAFDRNGRFVAGDERLRGDGLPVGREPPPPTARQMAIVPTRDGYVLLIPRSNAVVRGRVALVLWLLGTMLVVGLLAFGAGRVWSGERVRSYARVREHLGAIAAGERPAPLPPDDDPVIGELSNAAGAAFERLALELDSRAAGEDRLRAFLGEAGHELRTPLAIAVGYVGILKRGAIGDPALAERIVGDISTEHERLQRLVERILQLARLDAVPAQEGAASDAVRVAGEAIALVRPLDLERDIAIEGPSTAQAAIADDDLRDAIRNLLENAIRYAPGAPIRVRIAVDDDVAIWVRDEGPGMDAFTAQHAFDRFFRGADRGSVQGTGLGLAIVRRLVERARGSVSLQTQPGEGTTVEVRVPRAKPS